MAIMKSIGTAFIGYALVLFVVAAVLSVIGLMYGAVNTVVDLGIGFRGFMDLVFTTILFFVDLLSISSTRITWTAIVGTSEWVDDAVLVLNTFKSLLLSTG